MRLTWRYFDFDAHWAEFWAAWSTPEVQAILKYDMDTWCATQAHFEADGSRPTWTEGEPLWHLSKTDYWGTKIQDAADKDIERATACAKKTLSAQGLDLNEYRKRQWGPGDREEYEDEPDELWDRMFEEIMSRHEPKPGTIESLILFLGRNFMCRALLKTAQLMFGEEECGLFEEPCGDEVVLIPNQKLAFDLLYYFFSKDSKDSFGMLHGNSYNAMVRRGM